MKSELDIDFNLILSLMASGSNDFSGFADSSMMRNEINGNIEYIEKELLELEV